MSKHHIQTLVEVALCAAIALLIDLFIPSLSPGLKITVKMLPIFILALRRGVKAGLAGGFLWGVLQVLAGDAQILTAIQFIIEYGLAFAFLGFAGLLRPGFQKALKNSRQGKSQAVLLAIGACILGSFMRYAMHYIAGVWFWGEYAPAGQSPYLYSLIVNGGAFLSETLTCCIAIAILVGLYPKLFKPRL